MHDQIEQVDLFILNIYGNEHCRESLQNLYEMTFNDLCQLHNFVTFRSSIKNFQNHHQFQQMEAANNASR